MKDNSKTFRSLVLSLIATVVCILMLLSTTFAWYQTSTTSDTNVVRTGDFNVEFEYSSDCANWSVFNSSAKLFNDVTLLPGDNSDVMYIRVTNNNEYAVTASAKLIDLSVTEDSTDLQFYSKVVAGVATPTELKTGAASALSGMNNVTFVSDTFVPAKEGATPGRVIIALMISVPEDAETVNVEGRFKIMLNATQAHGSRTVTQDIGVGKVVTAVTVGGTPITAYTYNASTGILTFVTDLTGDVSVTSEASGTLTAIANAGVIAGAEVLSADDPDLAADPENASSTGILPNGQLRYMNAPLVVSGDSITANLGGMTPAEKDVDVIMEFSADQQPGSDLGTYGSYATDFFVSFDQNIPSDAVTMFGGYADFGWTGFQNTDIPIPAGQQVPMLGLMGVTIDYATVVNDVQDFLCAINIDFTKLPDNVDSVTVSLNLVMIDPAVLTSNEAYMDPTNHNVVFNGQFVIERPAPAAP